MSWVGLSSFPEFVVVFWIVGCCYILRWSVVISLVCGHFLARGLWSCPGLWSFSVVIFCACGSFPGSWSVVMSWVGLWSSAGSVIISWLVGCGHIPGSGSVIISWIVVCGHVLGGSVVIFWVCGHFLDRGLWSCPGSVVITWACGHFLARGLWSCPGWVCRHLLGLWSFSGSWAVVMSCVGLWSSPGFVVISWLEVCGHVLGEFVGIFWVCGSFPGSWAVVMS